MSFAQSSRSSRRLRSVSPGGPAKKWSPCRFRPEIETLEVRCLLDASFYSFNGSGNNVANPTWGEAGTDLIRLTPAEYANGYQLALAAPGPQRLA